MNLFQDLTPENFSERNLHWDNPPEAWQTLPEGGIRVTTGAKTDFFVDPAGKLTNDSAAFLWTAVNGDFVARAHVRPQFLSTYDAGVLMVRHDKDTWAKLCFEKTDFGTTAAVSVVTRTVSDDANGVDLDAESLWLQMARAGNVFALHYSLDGKTWRMVRLFRLDVPPTVRVGVVAQCPVGPGGTIDLLHFEIENRPIENVRAGS